MKRSSLAHQRKSDSISIGTASMDGDFDLDEKDDTKRKSRNLSEKKRRDQFNMLINELCSMVSTTSRKMDKSTVLRSTISFLRNHSEVSPQSETPDIQENWKPSFLSNEEFTHLMLEALDGFIIVLSSTGKILYTSESVTSLMGYLPSEFNSSLFDLIHDSDKPELFKLLNNAPLINENSTLDLSSDVYISLLLHMKQGPIYSKNSSTYELVNLLGTYYNWNASPNEASNSTLDYDSNSCSSVCSPMTPGGSSSISTTSEWRSCFLAMARLQTSQLLREMSLSDGSKNEFTSRHSLEWKYLFLDHRAPPIIGYLPFEVLGTSGYDYYHIDDLDMVAECHEALMQTGEGTSCYYRFLTKGQQWIWIQTRYYITYHQWNSKPEFIVCTHTVFSYEEVQQNLRKSRSSKKIDDSDAKVDSSSSSFQNPQQQQHSSRCKTPGSPLSPSPSVTRSKTMAKPKGSDVSAVSSSVHPGLSSVHSEQNSSSSSVISSATPSTFSSINCNNNNNPSPAPITTIHKIVVEDSGISQNISGLSAPLSVATVITPMVTVAALPQLMETNESTVAIGFGSSNFPSTEVQNVPRSDAVEALNHCDIGNMNPSQIQEYLRCRHQLIQQQIIFQQEELRRVSEQLMLVQFVAPPGGGLPALSSIPGGSHSSQLTFTATPAASMQPSLINTQNVSQEMLSGTVMTTALVTPTVSTTTAVISPQMGMHLLPANTHLTLPLTLSQEQAHIILAHGLNPPVQRSP